VNEKEFQALLCLVLDNEGQVPHMLEKQMRRIVHRFKEWKDPSCKSKVVILQSWTCHGHAQDIGMVGSGTSKRIPHRNMTYHISLKS